MLITHTRALYHEPLSEMSDDVTAVACTSMGKGSWRGCPLSVL